MQLKEYYVGMSYALKTYDRQIYKEQIDKLSIAIVELRKVNEPRKKFRFSRRDADFGVKSTSESQQSAQTENAHNDIPGVDGVKGESVTVNRDDTHFGAFKVVNCSDANIDIVQKTEVLFLKNLSKCTVNAALTKSTVFVDGCNDCVISVNCHQLRIHNSRGTTFRIFVTSKAIIEDCDGLTFSPYTFVYAQKEEDEVLFERKGKQNLWREVQDFNWLKEGIVSPHFTLTE